MADAYEAYNKIEGVTRSLYWAHVRRKFVNSIPLDSQKREIKESTGAEARKRIGDEYQSKLELPDRYMPWSKACCRNVGCERRNPMRSRKN